MNVQRSPGSASRDPDMATGNERGGTPEALLARYRATGDAKALGELFDAVAPELFGLSLHLISDAALAEDALQETFLAAIAHLDRHDPARPVVPWLVGILRMKVREVRRHHRRAPDPERLATPRREADPADAAAAGEEEARVRTALADLPEPYRRVALLRWRHGLSPAEIADLEGKPPGTIRSLLHRARERVRAGLGALALLLPPPGSRAPRGLDAVRAGVLARAARPAGVPAALATGGLLAMKKTLFAAAVLAVLAGGAWFLDSPPTRNDRPDRPEPAAVAAAPAAPAPAGADAAADPETVARPAFRGRVVGPDSAPVAGAEVLLLPLDAEPTAAADVAPERRGIAGDDGVFALAAADARAMVLVATVDGFAPTIRRGARPGAEVSLRLERGFGLAGTVTDPDGHPVEGARIRVLRLAESFRMERESTTGAAGKYRIDGLPPPHGPTSWYYPFEVMLVRVDASGFASHVDWLMASGVLGGARFHPEQTFPFDVALARGRAVAGRVVRLEDGTPVAGARIIVTAQDEMGSWTRSDGLSVPNPWSRREVGGADAAADGRFRFENLPAGSVLLRAEAPGLFGAPLWVKDADEPVVLELGGEAFVEGRVVDPEGRPLAGESVWLAGPDGKGVASDGEPTDADGRYVKRLAPRGESTLLVRGYAARGGMRREVVGDPPSLVVAPGERVRAPDLVLGPAGGRLRVEVVDTDGRPVPGARVLNGGPRATAATTDARGVAEVAVSPRNDATVDVRAPGYGPASIRVAPRQEGVVRERVVLPPGVTLTGRVIFDDGSPTAGAYVSVADAAVPVEGAFAPSSGAVFTVLQSDTSGRFRIEDLPPGPWNVQARTIETNDRLPSLRRVLTGVTEGEIEIRLPPDDRHLVDIEIRTVEAATGDPVPADVRILGPAGILASRPRTDPDRRCTVPAGEWTLEARAEGYRFVRRAVRIEPDEGPVVVELEVGVLARGRFDREIASAGFSAVGGAGSVSLRIEPGGDWRAAGLSPGRWRLAVRLADGTELVPEGGAMLEIAENDVEVEFRPDLVAAGVLSVRLRDDRFPPPLYRTGKPTAAQRAFAAASRLRVLDAAGAVVLSEDRPIQGTLTRGSHLALAPGRYVVELTTPDGTDRREATVVAGRETPLVLP